VETADKEKSGKGNDLRLLFGILSKLRRGSAHYKVCGNKCGTGKTLVAFILQNVFHMEEVLPIQNGSFWSVQMNYT